MCYSKVTANYAELGEGIRIGYKVFRKSTENKYFPPLMSGEHMNMGEWYQTNGFISVYPFYMGGYHVFDRLEDAKQYLNVKDCVVCKVGCSHMVSEGIQSFFGDDVVVQAPVFCCLYIKILEELSRE